MRRISPSPVPSRTASQTLLEKQPDGAAAKASRQPASAHSPPDAPGARRSHAKNKRPRHRRESADDLGHRTICCSAPYARSTAGWPSARPSCESLILVMQMVTCSGTSKKGIFTRQYGSRVSVYCRPLAMYRPRGAIGVGTLSYKTNKHHVFLVQQDWITTTGILYNRNRVAGLNR